MLKYKTMKSQARKSTRPGTRNNTNDAACMIRVIVADDHTILRQGLVKLLRSSGGVAVEGECCNGQEALQLIRAVKPDIAILDISMPLLDGIEVSKIVSKELPATKIILLTMHKEPVVVKKAMRAGISGYIIKDSAFQELLDAIACVVTGGIFLSSSLNQEFLNITAENTPILTGRETEVLQLIVYGFNNKIIAKKFGISIKTVDSHRTSIMHKLDTHTTADLVRYALKGRLVK